MLDDVTHSNCLFYILQVHTHLDSPARYQVKPSMTLDHQILNQTIKWSHPSTQSSALVVQHGHPSPENDLGITGHPLTTLLTLGKEDDNVEWHVCLMAVYENI